MAIKIEIDRTVHGYTIELTTEKGACFVRDYGNSVEGLICSLLDYMGDVPFGPRNFEKYYLLITESAKDRLGEIHSNVLEIIVKHHNNIV